MGCKKVDLLLKSDTEPLPPALGEQPLPMLLKTCQYVLSTSVVETLKKCRQLRVSGSVTSGKLIIGIEGETIKTFEFENETAFTLVEDLNKGDKIVFLYLDSFPFEGNTVINVKAEIVKK